MLNSLFREELSRLHARGTVKYDLKRRFVSFASQALGSLLVHASTFDEELRQEVAGFPDGLVIGFSVLGDTVGFKLQCQSGRLIPAPQALPAKLEITFKHVEHAFLVLAAQQSTPSAYASQRLLTQGDPALSLRFMRCLNRVQVMALPKSLAERAMKSVPDVPAREKARFLARVWKASRSPVRSPA